MINKLDTKAEERFQEREERRLETFLEAEEERRRNQHKEDKEMRKLEREHEERMQGMFMGYMQQMMPCSFNLQLPHTHWREKIIGQLHIRLTSSIACIVSYSLANLFLIAFLMSSA